ncbi:MAG TPA: DUF2330 domain-containing protein [Myxococcales bacterium]|jgi:hypothetical protein
MMRSLLATLCACAFCLLAAPAYPCGGGFGAGITIDSSQTILVTHRAGVESYVFRPHFCGQAAQFGLILPVPATLTANPVLADPALFAELDRISAPTHVARTECRGRIGPDAGAANYAHDGGVSGPEIIDYGQVGIFDWVLLKADSAASFTAWLDANGFPHDASAEPLFSHYVQKGWFFVAFKVTAGESAPPAGSLLCGDLGPIQVSFTAAVPVVPTRIAAASTSAYSTLAWRIYAVAERQLGASMSEYHAKLRFSGALDSAALASAPELAKLAVAGDRLTKFEVFFSPSTEADLALASDVSNDFRETIDDVTYVDCAPPGGGCSSTGTGAMVLGASALALAPLLWRRRRR